MEGTPFGRYRLLDMLGRGGMGEVWRAYDTAIERIVALKVLPASFADDEAFQQRFRREARAAAGLDEPHVVPIHDVGEIDGRLYVTMRLIEGRDVHTLLRDGPLSPQRAVLIVEQIASALHAAHRIGLVHRDVKPSNILVTDDDFAYLIDFGIARSTGETGLTGTGNVVGTWAYIAPERLTDGVTDPRSDVYSLACVLHECLTGSQPFPNNSLEQQIAAHISMPPPRPSAMRAEVPVGFDDVIARGMAKDPEQRYTTTKELAAAARSGLTNPASSPPPFWTPPAPAAEPAAVAGPTQYGPSSPTVHRPSGPIAAPSRPPRKSRRRLAFAGVAVIVAVVAATVAFVLPNRDEPAAAPVPSASPAARPDPTTAEVADDGPLSGVYRAEFGRGSNLRDVESDSQPPVITEFAFRSSCSDVGCVATATHLKDGATFPEGASRLQSLDTLVFDDIGGEWISVLVRTGQCSAGATVDVWEKITLQPQPDGSWTGEFIGLNQLCGFKRSITLTRVRDVTAADGVAEPADVPARTPSPGSALRGRYALTTTFVGIGQFGTNNGLVANTLCLRTEVRCATMLDDGGSSSFFTLFDGANFSYSQEYDSPCPNGAGDTHQIQSWTLALPQPAEDPIAFMSGTGHNQNTGACSSDTDITVDLVRQGD